LLHTVIPLFFAAPRKPWGKAHTLHGAPEMPGGAPGLSGRGEGGQHLAWACLEMPGGAPGLSGRPTKAHWGPPWKGGKTKSFKFCIKEQDPQQQVSSISSFMDSSSQSSSESVDTLLLAPSKYFNTRHITQT
jgi:hypothetical protein